MELKTVVRGTAYTVGTVWSIAAAVAGFQFDGWMKKLLSALPLVVVLLFTLWDRWAWRWRPFVRLSGLPDLAGTWLGTYEAEWTKSDGSRHHTSGQSALLIRQTYTKLSITFITRESKSYSIFAHLTHLSSGEYRVDYQYDNTPNVDLREKMAVHAGSAQLTIATARGAHLNGEYWTNRLSRGSLRFEWISRQLANTVEAASALTNNASGRDI